MHARYHWQTARQQGIHRSIAQNNGAMKEKLTGGQLVVKSLIAAGTDTVFGLPGVQNDWLFNAFYDYQDKIRVIHTRHEQGAAYMALGYNLASGKPGVYSVVPGPGVLNSSAGLVTAYGLSAKVLCLVGQIPSKAQGKGWNVLHEVPGQLDILKALTKWADAVKSPSEAPLKIAQAFRQLYIASKPVALEIPMDILEKQEVMTFEYHQFPRETYVVDEGLIERAAQLLGQARHPLIFVGAGAMDAAEEVTQLAEALQAPVFSYRTGKGILSSRHPLSLPMPTAHGLWSKADVVIGIGSQVRDPLMKWGTDPNLEFISINIDPTVHDRIVKPSIAITADASEALKSILGILSKYNSPRASREKEMLDIKVKWAKDTAYLEPQTKYLQIIREELPDNGIFVDELTQVGFASRMIWEANQPRTYLSTGYMGTLGWGFPTALGAKVARPETPVVSITGDGGFMFNVQELATAVQHHIGVVVLLFNNNAYGNVRSMQEKLYGNRVIATDLKNPDFVALAQSFGANAIRANTPAELRKALRESLYLSTPTIIEIPISRDIPSSDDLKSFGKIR
jgi:acetolactate synthase-1/2/3 large subunit